MANFGQLETTKAAINWATAINKWVTIGRLLGNFFWIKKSF
jgi:hypothetical protein